MHCGPTSDHEEIKQWAARHGAVPAELHPYVFDGEPSVMRFLFGEAAKTGTRELRPITWESFFAQFDLQELVMVYDDSPNFTILQLTPDLEQMRIPGSN